MNLTNNAILDEYECDVLKIDLSNKKITGLLDLSKFKNLVELCCSHNKITRIDNIPSSVNMIDCSFNKLTRLCNLPPNLIKL